MLLGNFTGGRWGDRFGHRRRGKAQQHAEIHAATVVIDPLVERRIRDLGAPEHLDWRDAVTAGEAVIVGRDASTAVGLVPDFEYDEMEDESDFEPEPTSLSWTVYSVPTTSHVG